MTWQSTKQHSSTAAFDPAQRPGSALLQRAWTRDQGNCRRPGMLLVSRAHHHCLPGVSGSAAGGSLRRGVRAALCWTQFHSRQPSRLIRRLQLRFLAADLDLCYCCLPDSVSKRPLRTRSALPSAEVDTYALSTKASVQEYHRRDLKAETRHTRCTEICRPRRREPQDCTRAQNPENAL